MPERTAAHEHSLADARTFLFVPATRPDRYRKALESGADAIVIDLEDAVALSDKRAGREALADALPGLLAEHPDRVVVRVNSAGSGLLTDDSSCLRPFSLPAVMLAKAEEPSQVSRLADGLAPGTWIIPLIESGRGLDRLQAIARSRATLRLALGHLDLAADLGMQCDSAETPMIPVRFAMVLASRLAGLPAPVDGVTLDIMDKARLRADVARSIVMGFGAKLCIHPTQVAPAMEAFRPSEGEIARALRIVEAARAAHGAAVEVDGRMVDAPVLRLAERILHRAGRT